jgi:hypothetical protein
MFSTYDDSVDTADTVETIRKNTLDVLADSVDIAHPKIYFSEKQEFLYITKKEGLSARYPASPR